MEPDKDSMPFPPGTRVRVVDETHAYFGVAGAVFYIADDGVIVVSLDNNKTPWFNETQLELVASRPQRACRGRPLVPEAGAREGEIDAGDNLQATLNAMSPGEQVDFLRSLNKLTEIRACGIAPGERGLYTTDEVERHTALGCLGKYKLRNLKHTEPAKGAHAWTMRMTATQRASMEIDCACGDWLWSPPSSQWEWFRGNIANDDRDNPNAVFVMVLVHAKKPKEPRDSILYVFAVAIRKLAKGEQIWINYGTGLNVDLSWNHRVIDLS